MRSLSTSGSKRVSIAVPCNVSLRPRASTPRRGVLALGRKETLRGTAIEDRYEPLKEAERIYRRS